MLGHEISEQDKQPASGHREAPAIPPDMREFNRKVTAEFRANGGELSGQMAGRSLILLTTEGARSGEPRTTVLGYGRDRDRFIVIASDNGAPEDPAWYRNLLANPIGKVEAGAEKFEVRAATAGPEERSSLAATVPWLESQQKLTSREIPVVVLEPVRDHG